MYVPQPNDKDFAIAPAGTHLAVCYRVIDLGSQPSTYNNVTTLKHKVLLTWELPEEPMEDGRPFSIGKRYTWSMSNKATLRKDLESWRGKPFVDADFGPNGFDIRNLLGKPCLLNIVHTDGKEKTYANIASVSRLMKGQLAPDTTANAQTYLWISKERFDSQTLAGLSDNMRKMITETPEYKAMLNGEDEAPPVYKSENPADGMDDEIPF